MPTVAQLEQQKSNAKEFMETRDLALRLSQNADFRKLILNDYMIHEAARLVALSADPVLDDRQKTDAMAMAQAPGHLKRYLTVLQQMGDKAEQDMEELELMLEEARNEEAQSSENGFGDPTDVDQGAQRGELA